MENSLELLKIQITQNNYIGVDDILMSSTNELLKNISRPEFLNFKEHPNFENIKSFVEIYEDAVTELCTMIALLVKFGDLNGIKQYKETLKSILNKLIKKEKNETDGYGYIWKHLSNYPLLIIFYTINMSLLRRNYIDFLFYTMNIPYNQRYMGIDLMESVEITLPEAINSYHLFNNVDYINVDIYQYLPNQENNTTSTKKILVANNRIFKYLLNNISEYFDNEEDYDDYFDLYEYFTGLYIMDKRLSRYVELPDRKRGEFAPYGRKYWMYSESGRYFHYKDSIVHKFIQDTIEKKNEILKAGFFGGKKENFVRANDYYKDLLKRLTGY